ncbi:MAG: peptidase MA family metallohydrolase [Thermodesulfovibrionales bacterium]
MMTLALRLILLTALLLCIVPLPAAADAGMLAIGNAQATVRFDTPLQGAAQEVLRIYPAVRSELLTDLGWETSFRPEIILLKDHASFRKVSGSDLITALAIPGKDRIVIDFSKMGSHPFTLKVTLKHELCHLELHHGISADKLPRWFNEGICQWVTGGFDEIISDGSRSRLREAVLSKRLVGIEGLAAGFASDGQDLLLAYEVSRSIIDYIKKKYGDPALRKILEQMRSGDDLESAFRSSLSVTLAELEEQWRASLSPGNAWLFYLRDNLYEMLFVAAALLTICGFFRVLKKKREYKDDEDEDEEGEGKDDEKRE